MSNQSNFEIDIRQEAQKKHGSAVNAMRYLRPFMDAAFASKIRSLINSSRDKNLTDGLLRSMVGEIAGLDYLMQQIESEITLNKAKMESSDG